MIITCAIEHDLTIAAQTDRPQPKGSRWLYALLLALVALALSACTKPPEREPFKAIDITGANYARDFSLTDENGQHRTLADFRGKVVLMFFGYTQCPDVCPTTMADFASVIKRLGPDGKEVQVLFVTIDPARDTADVLKHYVANFAPDFLGLYGTDAQTAAVAKEFKVFYQKVDGPTENSYSMDHTPAIYAFDAAGHVRLYIAPNATPDDVAHDVKLLLAPAAA